MKRTPTAVDKVHYKFTIEGTEAGGYCITCSMNGDVVLLLPEKDWQSRLGLLPYLKAMTAMLGIAEHSPIEEVRKEARAYLRESLKLPAEVPPTPKPE